MHGQKTWTIKLTKQKRDKKKKEEKRHVIGTQICLIKCDCKEYGSCRGRGLMGLLMAMVAQSDEEGVADQHNVRVSLTATLFVAV